jgi:hypothetical protein
MVEAAMSGADPKAEPASRRLVRVWLVLAVLAAGIVLIEMRDRKAVENEMPAEEPWLLPVEITQVGAIEIVNKGTLHRFERDSAGLWFYHGIHADTTAEHSHVTDPVAADKIDASLVGFSRARKERRFPLKVEADEFGVTRPDIFIMVYRPKEVQPLARYAVGIVAPDGVSRYVLPVGSNHVITIANYQIDNLLNLVRAVGEKSAQGNPKK